nr:MAG TPA: DNA pilot protein [Microviridae sp.]
MSLFGIGASTVAGIAGNLLGGWLGGKQSAANSAAAMEQQNKYNVENYKHRYQWSVEDMRKAGLNPILAATNGISGSFGGSSAIGAGVNYDLSGGAASGASAENSAASADKTRKMISYEQDLIQGQIAKMKQEENESASRTASNNLDVQQKEQLYAERLAYERKMMEINQNNALLQGGLYAAQINQANSSASLYSMQQQLGQQDYNFWNTFNPSPNDSNLSGMSKAAMRVLLNLGRK